MDKADKDILKQVLEATYEHKLLKLQYFTSEGKDGPVREIEPYAVIETKSGVMIRAYQRAPIPGWRFFHLDQIVSLTGSTETFKPRRGATIRAGGQEHNVKPVESENEEQAEYRRRVLEAVADLKVAKNEAAALQKYRDQYGLTKDEIRAVHYKIFSDCLDTIVQDDLISDEEIALLNELNACLKACGAGILD